MQTSETGSLTDARAGFSLIELVVVVAIISIVSLGMMVGLNADSIMKSSRSDGAERRAQSLKGAVTTARDQALLMRRLHALVPRQDGWTIQQFHNGQWHETAYGHQGEPIAWSIGGMPVLLRTTSPADDISPSIFFLEDGRSTPFSATFRASDSSIRCATDGWEPFRCRAQ